MNTTGEEKAKSSSNQKEETDAESEEKWMGAILDHAARVESTFLLYLSTLAYCALTVATSTDKQLVLNQQTRLPILNVDVGFYPFFWGGPILCIGVYIAFQLQVSKFYKLLTNSSLTVRVYERRWYGWMGRLPNSKDWWLTDRLRGALSDVVNAWILPVVLALFAIGFLRTHQRLEAVWLLLLFLVGVFAVFYFRWERRDFWMRQGEYAILVGVKRWWQEVGTVLLGVLTIFFVAGYSLYLGTGTTLGNRVTVNLDNQVLVTGGDRTLRRYWVDLSGKRLDGASLQYAVMKRANLTDTRLEGADLRGANLVAADLTDADLVDAEFGNTDLRRVVAVDASFRGADLQEDTLQYARLQEADFQGADLEETSFANADLHDARFADANLEGVSFQGATLVGTEFAASDTVAVDSLSSRLSVSIKSLVRALCEADTVESINPAALDRRVTLECEGGK
jgi:hypothetical protein